MRVSVLASLFLLGCAYSSQYTPPADGRARAVWRDDHVVVDTGGVPLWPACMQQLGWVSRSDELRLATGDYPIVSAPPVGTPFVVVATGFWLPHYWGPPIVAPAPGVAPLLPQPPLFLPTPSLVAPRPGVVVRPPPSAGAPPSVGNDGGKVLVVLAAVALLAMPALAVGLAAARPESGAANAEAIDQANLLNDWLRTPASPCAPAYGGPS
jgi:hypothetical protein